MVHYQYEIRELVPNERLRDLRRKFNMTQGQLAEVLNIKQGSYSDIERGRLFITPKLVGLLVDKLNMNPNWYYLGEGSMFLDNYDVDWVKRNKWGTQDESDKVPITLLAPNDSRLISILGYCR